MVSASEDGTLRVWKINSGDIQWVFKGHTDAVKAVTSMGDGLIASSSLDLTLRVWKLGSAEPLHVIGPTFANALLGVSKEILIADSIRGRLAIWNVVSGDSLVELDGHTSWVNAVVTVGDGRIVSASADETLRLWDLASPQQWERRSEDHSGRVNAVTCLSDGCVVTASDDWTLMIWDPDSGEALHVLEGHTGRVTAVTELGDGLIVSASDDNTLRVWDIESCITLRVLEGSGLSIVNLGNGRFVSPSSDNTLRVWRVDSDEALQVLIGHKAPVVAVADLGKRQITSLSLDLTLRVWDLDSGDTLREIREVKFHRVIDLGQRSILALHSMKLWIGDDSSCNSTGAQADPYRVLELQLLDGNLFNAVANLGAGRLVTASDDNTLRVWDTESGECLAILTLDAPSEALAITTTTKGPVIVLGDETGRVHFVDLTDDLRSSATNRS